MLVLVTSACSGTDADDEGAGSLAATTTTTPAEAATTERGALAAASVDADVLVGAAVDADRLQTDPAYRALVATHFTSVTPENAMKWSVTRPGPGEWDWTDADAVVELAEAEGLEVRGHTLVWGQDAGNGLPEWMAAIDDPDELRAAVEDGIRKQVGRYAGRVDRWDVVNEPLSYVGGELAEDPYVRLLGPDHIAEAFRIAHEADPDAELWLNDFSTEIQPDKADALVELVTGLVGAGVPIDGVGFQTHLNVAVPLPPGAVVDTMERIRALDLDVAVTELDVPLGPTRDEDQQRALYRQVVEECLAAGCTEVTVWGVSDDDTWLDSPSIRAINPIFDAWSIPSRPLLFDEDDRPKPTYQAVVEALGSASA